MNVTLMMKAKARLTAEALEKAKLSPKPTEDNSLPTGATREKDGEK